MTTMTGFVNLVSIKVGTHKTVGGLRSALVGKGFYLDADVSGLLDEMSLVESEREILLHSANLEEITGVDFTNFGAVHQTIHTSKDYDLCPPETVFQLMLQYPYCVRRETWYYRLLTKPLHFRNCSKPYTLGFNTDQDGKISPRASIDPCCCGMTGKYHFIFMSRM